MRSLQMTEPGDKTMLGVVDRDEPGVSDGQVLIRVAFAGLNFTDVLARRGAPGYAGSWPFVPGMEVGGAVVEVGPGVESFKPGQTVVAFTPDGGGYAELVAADARLTAVVPDGLDLAVATTVPLTLATAVGLTRRAHVGQGDRVLVTSGAGGVGGALAAVLDAAGAGSIVGGIGSPSKRDQLAAQYSPVVRGEDPQAFYAQTVDAAGGLFDVILDSVGGYLIAAAPQYLAVGGRLISYGGAAGQPDPEPAAYAALRAGNQTVSGFSILRLARTAPEQVTALIREALTRATGGLPVASPQIIGWDQLIDTHLLQSEGRLTGKTVLAVR